MSKQSVRRMSGAFVLGMAGILLLLTLVSPRSIVNAQSRNTMECIETEFTLPENSWITNACYTDEEGDCTEEVPAWEEQLTGRIWYSSTQDGAEEVLELSLDTSFQTLWPIAVYVNEHPWGGLPSLVGRHFKEVKSTKFECIYNAGSGPWMKIRTYWIVQAKLSEGQGGGSGGGGSGGGGGGAGEPAEFEGFIELINDPDVTISKEGRSVMVTVTGDTAITLNGNAASLADLQPGDKAKATYDPGTSVASEIKVEAER